MENVTQKPVSTYHGNLVAIEGEADVVATQLRLLPPSGKILVLPTLVEPVQQISNDLSFDARSYIRNVRNIFTDRLERAASFLQLGTIDHPRLVFMNGGSYGAQTMCITAICKNVTNGCIQEAEAIYQDITKDGASALMDHAGTGGRGRTDPANCAEKSLNEARLNIEQHWTAPTYIKDPEEPINGSDTAQEGGTNDPHPEPVITNWNDESEVLEHGSAKETQSQQEHDVTRPRYLDTRSNAVDNYEQHTHNGHTSSQTAQLPLGNMGGAPQMAEDDSGSAESRQDVIQEVFSLAGSTLPPRIPGVNALSSSKMARMHRPALLNRRHTRSLTTLRTMKTFSNRTLRQARSEHDLSIYIQGPINSTHDADISTGSSAWLPTRTIDEVVNTSDLPVGDNCVHTMLKTFVDRGTSPQVFQPELLGDELIPDPSEHAPFRPIFPKIEDLVIKFTGMPQPSAGNGLFQSQMKCSCLAMKSSLDELMASSPFMDSAPFPKCCHCDRHDPDVDDLKSSSETQTLCSPESIGNLPSTIDEELCTLPSGGAVKAYSSAQDCQKVYEFRFSTQSAVSVQNSFRGLLSALFPVENTRYRQHFFDCENDRLWKPVFRAGEEHCNKNGYRRFGVDQILAVGWEDGVSDAVYNDIFGRVVNLGIKRDGSNRAAKLDISYLIVNAMQRYHTVQAETKPDVGPLSDNEQLATMLVPELETFLAFNKSIRFLALQFQPQYLSTVLALRELIGVETFQVAAVMNALAQDPPSTLIFSKLNLLSDEVPSARNSQFRFSRDLNSPGSIARARAELNKREELVRDYAITSKRSSTIFTSSRGRPSTSWSSTDLLLLSTATEDEIAAFTSEIRKTLIEKDTFYTAEPEIVPEACLFPVALSEELHSPRVVTPASISLPALRMASIPPRNPARPKKRAPKAENLTRVSPPRTSDSSIRRQGLSSSSDSDSTNNTSDNYTFSPSTISTYAMSSQTYSPNIADDYPVEERRSRTICRDVEWVERQSEHAWAAFVMGEDGASDDEIDRMLMPVRTPKPRKASTRKALKWLGLS